MCRDRVNNKGLLITAAALVIFVYAFINGGIISRAVESKTISGSELQYVLEDGM